MIVLLVIIFTASCSAGSDIDPLPSWRAGATRASIINFVEAVSDPENADYVAVEERIAVFDNDGTLWSEQPLYFQLYYALARVEQHAQNDSEWAEQEPYRTALLGDRNEILALGTDGLVKLILATHSGMTNKEFRQTVTDWMNTARHPTTDRAFSKMIYQPMLELLNYLRANDFRVYIVSGGGVEFMRAWAEDVYGVPPQNAIGSNLGVRFEQTDAGPVLRRMPEIDFINDGPGKPVGIQRAIGRRPIFAFGNSDGDLQMLQWAVAGEAPGFAGIVHHTDGDREWAYDRESHVGRLDKALDEAGQRGWTVVDMKADWAIIHPVKTN
jgi:phosphoserine phosphatase